MSLDRIRHSLRLLGRQKRFTALAVASLAIAVALNTTMYSVLDAMISPNLSIREPERIYTIEYFGDYRRIVPEQEKLEGMRQLKSFAMLGVQSTFFFGAHAATSGSRSRDARVATVSPNYFDLLGVRASAGRLLTGRDVGAAPRPVVISERLWRQLFPDRQAFDTATFELDNDAYAVVGLLPDEADFPGRNTDVWQIWSAAESRRFGPIRLFNIGRLRDGVTIEEARGELNALAQRWSAMTPNDQPGWFRVSRAVGEPFRFQRFHLALIGAVVAVLLVACFNLANLQLARGISRSRELATRSALGASRGDIIGQLLLEATWLALAGLVLGVLLTFWGMRLVTASIPPSLSEFLLRPQTSWRVFAFATVAALASLLLVGLIPAIRLSRVDINEVLKSGAGTGASKRKRRQYGSLAIVQISLALTLLVAATLLLRVSAQLAEIELNPKFERLVQGFVSVANKGPADRRRLADISAQVVSAARATPTVADAATFIMVAPKNRKITVDDPGGTPLELGVGLFAYGLVSSSYIRTIGLRIVKGRDFLEGEFGERLVIVDERTATYLWPGANPIGRLIKLSDARTDGGWLKVIGVVHYENYWAVFNRANQAERLAPRMGAVYVLNGTDTSLIGAKGATMQIIVRGTTRLEQLPGILRERLTDDGNRIRVSYMERLRNMLQIDRVRERQNFVSGIFTTFALIALAVAALGVYAIVSHSVSQRTREFGVRIAVGAGERDIRQKVLFEGNVIALVGIALGLIVASRTAGLLQAFLRGEEDVYDSWLYAIAAIVLFAMTLLASWIPARRAMRINPVEALRNE